MREDNQKKPWLMLFCHLRNLPSERVLQWTPLSHHLLHVGTEVISSKQANEDRSCKPYLYKKELHDWVIGSNYCTILHVYLLHVAGGEDDEQHTWGASAGIKKHISFFHFSSFFFSFFLTAFITRGNRRNNHRNITSAEIRSIIMWLTKWNVLNSKKQVLNIISCFSERIYYHKIYSRYLCKDHPKIILVILFSLIYVCLIL